MNIKNLFEQTLQERVPLSPQTKAKNGVELARTPFFVFVCNAPPQAGRDVGAQRRNPGERAVTARRHWWMSERSEIRYISQIHKQFLSLWKQFINIA